MPAPSPWISQMRCCLIADRAQCAEDFEPTIEVALRGGVRSIQLREKQATTRELYDVAIRLRQLTRRHEALFFINDRADIALAVEADGVHLGWQSMPAGEVRRLIGHDRLIGQSVHNPDEAIRAVEAEVDYVFASPVFETPSKAGLVPTLGINGLCEIRKIVNVPVIALGGIHPSNVSTLAKTGVEGIAVIRAILQSPAPAVAAKQLLETFAEGF